MKPLVMGTAAIAALLLAAPGHADTTDDQYVAALQNHGLIGKPADWIKVGRLMCGQLADGEYTITGMEHHVALIAQQISANDAKFWVDTAVTSYCPQFSG